MEVPLDKYKDWPPFYTLQPNLDVRAQQLHTWARVILEYAQAKRLFVATKDDFRHAYRNKEIGRSLNDDFVSALFHSMAKDKQVVKHGDGMFVFWKSPESWGELVHQWAVDYGRVGSVETVEGLAMGDDTSGQEFHSIPVAFLHFVLKALQKTGKCELFEVGDNWAVKFFN